MRMDQPFSRAADALMDRQYWAPDDAQKHPYDDTGWSFPALFNVHVARVTDAGVLKARMVAVEDPAVAVGKARRDQVGTYVVANTGQGGLPGARVRLKGAGQVAVVEKEFAGRVRRRCRRGRWW